MDFETFLGEVQHRAELESTEEALRTTRCTLTALSARIRSGEAADLAAQLPDEIGRFLTTVDSVDSFPFADFLDRVVECGDYGDERAAAAEHAKIVVDAVAETVTSGELDDLREQLPEDGGWDQLFELVDEEHPNPNPSD